MWEISKEFEFDFGHRVWTQNLNDHLAGTRTNKCRHLHGHRAKLIVEGTGEKLPDDGMLFDFNHLNWVKRFIDEHFDHKFLVHTEDPMLKTILGAVEGAVLWPVKKKNFHDVYWDWKVITSDAAISESEREFIESFVVLYFVPTAEELSRFFLTIIRTELAAYGIHIRQVTFYETPKCKSVFYL